MESGIKPTKSMSASLMRITIITLVMLIITVLLTFLTYIFPTSIYRSIYLPASIFLMGIFGYSIIKLLIETPTTIAISLLGYPHSGKTVFVTVLLNELMIKSTPGIIFSPYGSETIDKVTKDITTLRHGRWLPKTEVTEVFFYRAKAIINIGNAGFLKRLLKIEISDYAGEHIKEFDPTEENWFLHKTEYFRYAVESDAIILSIDSEVIMKARKEDNTAGVSGMENSFIADLQILMEKKGVDIDKKLRAPLALTFMKCDLVPEEDRRELPKIFPRLTSFCRKRCSNFEIFQVSSVGQVTNDGSPPKELEPLNIADPIIWILQKI